MSNMRTWMQLCEGNTGLRPLPKPGEKPWWVTVLAPMTRALRSWGNWTWTTGGCFAFADRLQKAYGGQLWCVARYDPEEDDWAAEHAVVRIGGMFYDYNGVFDPQRYITALAKDQRKKGDGPYRHEMKRKGSSGLFWFDDEYLDDTQWKQLLNVLRTGRFTESINEAVAPTVLYHATFNKKVASIMAHGLGAGDLRRNYEISRPGVVNLSDDTDAAEAYVRNSQFGADDSIALLAIDITRLKRSLLHRDRNDEGEFGGNNYEYRGIIPPAAISIYAMDDMDRYLNEAAEPMSRPEFEAGVVENFKRNETADSPWRRPVTIHHGTDSYRAQEIYQSGHFHSGDDWPSFFTTSRTEADDYARIRARQARTRRPDATPVVITVTVPPYAVRKNSGSGEIETHTGLPLYFRGQQGYLRDQDIAAAEARWNKGDPRVDYDAYLADFARHGAAASGMEQHRQQLDLRVPQIGPNMKPTGEVRIGDLGYWELLRTHEWLKRKRTPAYQTMRDAVYARGMQLQRERQT